MREAVLTLPVLFATACEAPRSLPLSYDRQVLLAAAGLELEQDCQGQNSPDMDAVNERARRIVEDRGCRGESREDGTYDEYVGCESTGLTLESEWTCDLYQGGDWNEDFASLWSCAWNIDDIRCWASGFSAYAPDLHTRICDENGACWSSLGAFTRRDYHSGKPVRLAFGEEGFGCVRR